MSRIDDRDYLLRSQYSSGANLGARIAIHHRFSTNRESLFYGLFTRLLEVAPANARVLEVGSGSGRMWSENLDRIPEGWQITLSDFSPGMLEDARRSLEGDAHRFDFRIIEAQDIPYPDDSFDVVIANFMLYHVPDRPRAIREIRRVLRPAGTLIAATNGPAHMREMELLERRLRTGSDDFGHAEDTSPDAGFGLQNGEEQLRAAFETVAVHRHDDALVVTEAEPIVQYALSYNTHVEPSRDDVDAFRRHVEGILERDGAIRITKESGYFEAR